MSHAADDLLARLPALIQGEKEGTAADPAKELAALLGLIRTFLRTLTPPPLWKGGLEQALADLEVLPSSSKALARAYRIAWRLLGAAAPDQVKFVGPSGELNAGARWALLVRLSLLEAGDFPARIKALEIRRSPSPSRDPVLRALGALEATREPGSVGNYGDRQAPGIRWRNASFRCALEQALTTPLGLVRLVVEEAHSGFVDCSVALAWLMSLLELVEDPILRLEHGDQVKELSALIRLYAANHLGWTGYWQEARTLAQPAFRFLENDPGDKFEIRTIAAIFSARAANAEGRTSEARRLYTAASETARKLDPPDYYAEIVVEEASVFGPVSRHGTSILEPPTELGTVVEGWQLTSRPELQWELYMLEAEQVSADFLGTLARSLEGCRLEELGYDRLRAPLFEAQDLLARLGRIATLASPLATRYRFGPEGQLRVWQWWARSELVSDPSEAASLLARAIEVSLPEGLLQVVLDLLLDLIWARVAEGCPGSDLLETPPIKTLLSGRRKLRLALRDLYGATILSPDPQMRRGILDRFAPIPGGLSSQWLPCHSV